MATGCGAYAASTGCPRNNSPTGPGSAPPPWPGWNTSSPPPAAPAPSAASPPRWVKTPTSTAPGCPEPRAGCRAQSAVTSLSRIPSTRPSGQASHTGRTGERGGPVMHQAIAPATAAALLPRRSVAGTVRVSGRDIDGLILCGEMYGAPYDLLAECLNVQPDRLRGIVARWRAAGYAETGRLGPGPAWCWLTRPGLAALGLRFPAGRPSLGRLAHLRAVLAARLGLESSPAGQMGQPWWRSERRIRAAIGGRAAGHIPDGEVSWPETPASPYPGERWAIE